MNNIELPLAKAMVLSLRLIRQQVADNGYVTSEVFEEWARDPVVQAFIKDPTLRKSVGLPVWWYMKNVETNDGR